MKKTYKFCQKMEVQPRIDIGLTKKRYMFCQENIERVGKGLVVSWFHLGFRLRGRSVEQVGYRVIRWEGSMEGKGWEKFDPKKKRSKVRSQNN